MPEQFRDVAKRCSSLPETESEELPTKQGMLASSLRKGGTEVDNQVAAPTVGHHFLLAGAESMLRLP